ncbi:MAG: glycine cleavage system aminomethyltransferase GcvT [Candidatus Altiarchaeota archaeon]
MQLKKTPLCGTHEKLGARMVDFGGWYMPVQYSGVVEEHNAVRNEAGLFDVSHMGEFDVQGAKGEAFLNRLVANDVSKMADGMCLYTPMCYENGTIVDDLIIYRYDGEHYLLVVNAGNIQKDWDWVNKNNKEGVMLRNDSDKTAEVAIQGPKAVGILQMLSDYDLSTLKKFRFAKMKVAGIGALVSRTGYTGEDGFEIYVDSGKAVKLWDALMEAGEGVLKPAGLGARDTLRLESAMMLYGNDIDNTTTPIEAGIGWTVKPEKGEFIGKAVVGKQKAEGTKRRLVGFKMVGPGIGRHGYEVQIGGKTSGKVTSGTYSPTLKTAIGLAYLPVENSTIGSEFDVMIRDKPVKTVVVETPFIKKK